jgi:hypothetical protein
MYYNFFSSPAFVINAVILELNDNPFKKIIRLIQKNMLLFQMDLHYFF